MRRPTTGVLGTGLALLSSLLLAQSPHAATASGAAFVSDDFASGVLDPSLWTVTDPAGEGTVAFPGAGTSNARLSLSVPSGTNYDPWGTNRALRATQPVTNDDFQAHVRFLSVPTAKYQTQGILVEQDATNWMRFEVHSDGSSLNMFAAKTVNGKTTTLLRETITAGTESQLRLTRTGDTWTLAHSTDGTTWITAETINHTIQATHIGPFAANGSPYPTFTADIDYFFDTAAPIEPEDGNTATTHTLTTTTDGQGTITRNPDNTTYPEGTDVTLTATPANGWTFTGWTGDTTGPDPTTTITMNTDHTVTATFHQDTPPEEDEYALTVSVNGDGTVQRSPSASTYPDGTDVTLTAAPAEGWTFAGWSGDASGTDESVVVMMDAPRSVTATFEQVSVDPPSVDVWYGDDQTFGVAGVSQRWVNVLGNVSDADGIQSANYRLNGNAPVGLSIGSDLRRLYGEGDVNVEIPYDDLSSGANTVAITATDTTGESATESVTVRKDVRSPSLPYSTSWGSSQNPNDVAQVVDGKWTSGSGGLTIVEPGYDRTVAVGDSSWDNYEVEVPVTVRGLTPGYGTPQSGSPVVGLALRWNGHTPRDTEEPAVGWYPTGAFAWYQWYDSGRYALIGNDGWPLSRDGAPWDFGTTYIMKARVESVAGGTDYSYKWWPQGTSEPQGWSLSVTDDNSPDTGGVLLIAHHVDATFGTVDVSPLGDSP
ncbi:putative repeat protein (TIGR02543 family) [Haloactinopolyspora alba]|uniref:Putative repeat protein (TIGR02543 family) n=1 Tax=Haloactinopolyspora alba TaxID=648780 RepID=A0A2P8E5J1_9ACTN|nr:DUF1349 domain-containing protein [Haloactinopolyspora alba]PSL04739.1 putative repeat protein (TIGR02543 family) [Haloactinopolyspora alba]